MTKYGGLVFFYLHFSLTEYKISKELNGGFFNGKSTIHDALHRVQGRKLHNDQKQKEPSRPDGGHEILPALPQGNTSSRKEMTSLVEVFFLC